MSALFLCLVLSCLVWAQSTNSNSEVQQKITNMETEMTTALLKGDLAASEKYLSSNYVRFTRTALSRPRTTSETH